MFDRVFPRLLQALSDAADRPMSEIRQATLIFLYRLLFILYAEDRGLLPVNDAAYDDYGLRKRVRDDVAQRKDRNDTFSSVATSYYDHLATLFRLIDRGDPSIGLPPYNGGLFAQDAAALLNDVRFPTTSLPTSFTTSATPRTTASAATSTTATCPSSNSAPSTNASWSSSQSTRATTAKSEVRPNPYARKDSGSFYTPQDLVDLIVDQTLKPLIEERLDAFRGSGPANFRSDRRPKADAKAELARLDPAQAVLDLKVLDPAMGSGHFLVTAVDFLTDYVADLIEVAPAFADWLPQDDPYQSPLLDRDRRHSRRHPCTAPDESNWKVNEAQLTDQAIIRRLVLKRCIYGVDKNPLTVELAKVSLWLHSFTVGAPLSFLDHHLRCGDSLLGLRIADATADLRRLKVPMFVESAVQGVENAAQGMRQIEELSDADVAEVHESQSLFHAVESATADLRGFLDTLAGLRWLTAGLKVRQRATLEAPLAETLGADPTQAFRLLTGGGVPSDIPASSAGTQQQPTPRAHASHPGEPTDQSPSPAFRELWTHARAAAHAESFLHWEAAFPGVWRHWQNQTPEGGFDAVIGNPPWDRIKLQEVEWFATRDPDLARAPTAAARREGIKRLRQQHDPLAARL